ncbi:hypothetical protein Xbud_03433 [Xenorhabdus budapestensis]|uniref:Transposase n=1 Tax=Xenorhabdus budapestensis TaxID=290110 RepID=A0A2D0IQ97_XENBU|nr:hypothetical protein Xbud_03433 [Xenorhabdus budapestensis]
MDTDAFSLYFGHIEDKRQSFKIQYPLCDILFLTVYATIAGAEGWQDIEDYGNGHVEWFQHQGLFKAGIPGHDTIARTIACIEPHQFQQCFIHWMQAVTLLTEGSLIAIDGKTLRASYNREDRCSAIHMVSAFAATNKVVLGQLQTDSKSNEITAIPALLSLLDIKGCLVSIDAMGCQKTIAAQIVEQGGDYLLAVKNNQPTLAKSVAQVLSGITVEQSETKTAHVEKGHGRIEAREYHVLPAQDLVSQCPQWNGLKSLGVAVGYRIDKSGKE